MELASEEESATLTWKCAPMVHRQRKEGGGADMAARDPSAQPRERGGQGTSHPSVRANRAHVGEQGGHPSESVRYPSAQPRRVGGGVSPITAVRATCAHARERGGHPNQEAQYLIAQPRGGGRGGTTPNCSVCTLRTTCRREMGGGGPEPEEEGVYPPHQQARHVHGRKERGGGRPTKQVGGGGHPRAGAHALRARPDTGDGGQPPRPEYPPYPH